MLGQVLESIQPESEWARRDSIFDRIELAATLDRGDEGSARAIAVWAEDLATDLCTPTARSLVPLFTALYATKDLRSLYVERRHSLMAQRQAAAHASAHLMDSIHALEAHSGAAMEQQRRGTMTFAEAEAQKRNYPTSPKTIGGIVGLSQRLEMRYTAQVKSLDAEAFRATAFLREMGSDEDGRIVEAVTGAREAELQHKLAGLLKELREESLQVMMAQRAKGMVVSRLKELAASRI